MELPLQESHPDAEQQPYGEVAVSKEKRGFLWSRITCFGDSRKSEDHGYGGWEHHGRHHGRPHEVYKKEIKRFPV